MFEPREPAETIKFVDDYCEWYRNLFPVRSFEAFKYLHIGMISDIKRKTLPAISRVVGLSNEQDYCISLQNHLGKSQLRGKIKADFTSISRPRNPLIIDETGDRKKETQQIMLSDSISGNGKNREQDSCSHSIWFMRGMTFPLTFEVYKPKQRLLKEDTYQSKPQIAAHMIRELK